MNDANEIEKYLLARLKAAPLLDKAIKDLEEHKEEILNKFIDVAKVALKINDMNYDLTNKENRKNRSV